MSPCERTAVSPDIEGPGRSPTGGRAPSTHAMVPSSLFGACPMAQSSPEGKRAPLGMKMPGEVGYCRTGEAMNYAESAFHRQRAVLQQPRLKFPASPGGSLGVPQQSAPAIEHDVSPSYPEDVPEYGYLHQPTPAVRGAAGIVTGQFGPGGSPTRTSSSAWRRSEKGVHLAVGSSGGAPIEMDSTTARVETGWRKAENVHLAPDGSISQQASVANPRYNLEWRKGDSHHLAVDGSFAPHRPFSYQPTHMSKWREGDSDGYTFDGSPAPRMSSSTVKAISSSWRKGEQSGFSFDESRRPLDPGQQAPQPAPKPPPISDYRAGDPNQLSLTGDVLPRKAPSPTRDVRWRSYAKNGFSLGDFHTEFQTSSSIIGHDAHAAVIDLARKRESALLRHSRLLV